MDEGLRAKLEAQLESLSRRGTYDEAATLAIRSYGPEIFGFLRAAVAGSEDPGEAFSDFAEALWRGLPSFGWNSTLRTWAYGIARNVSRERGRERGRRRKRVVDVDSVLIEGLAQQVRTETLSFLRTAKRTRLQALRESLSQEDRMLLVLRVDRGLKWHELARVFSDRADVALDDVSLVREAARLRKRFQLVKERLRAMARAEGLLD